MFIKIVFENLFQNFRPLSPPLNSDKRQQEAVDTSVAVDWRVTRWLVVDWLVNWRATTLRAVDWVDWRVIRLGLSGRGRTGGRHERAVILTGWKLDLTFAVVERYSLSIGVAPVAYAANQRCGRAHIHMYRIVIDRNVGAVVWQVMTTLVYRYRIFVDSNVGAVVWWAITTLVYRRV